MPRTTPSMLSSGAPRRAARPSSQPDRHSHAIPCGRPRCDYHSPESREVLVIRHVRKLAFSALHPIGRGARAARSQRSQALVEFAMVSPIFLLVLFSAIDISRLLYAYTA